MASKRRSRRSRSSVAIRREVEKVRFARFEELVARHLRDQGDVVTLDDSWRFVRAHPRHLLGWFKRHVATSWTTMTDDELRRHAGSAARSMMRWL